MAKVTSEHTLQAATPVTNSSRAPHRAHLLREDGTMESSPSSVVDSSPSVVEGEEEDGTKDETRGEEEEVEEQVVVAGAWSTGGRQVTPKTFAHNEDHVSGSLQKA